MNIMNVTEYRIQVRKTFNSFTDSHEEADDRIEFHINHAVVVDSIEAAIVCSGDTDVCTSLVYNYEYQWKQNGLRKLWQ